MLLRLLWILVNVIGVCALLKDGFLFSWTGVLKVEFKKVCRCKTSWKREKALSVSIDGLKQKEKKNKDNE